MVILYVGKSNQSYGFNEEMQTDINKTKQKTTNKGTILLQWHGNTFAKLEHIAVGWLQEAYCSSYT